jgi:hypothetical protein
MTGKWGGVQLNGTDERKRRCAEIAPKHGIRIANPKPRDVKPLEKHDTADKTTAPMAVTIEKETGTAPVRESLMNAKTSEAPAA